jgi:hypothetical protein
VWARYTESTSVGTHPFGQLIRYALQEAV